MPFPPPPRILNTRAGIDLQETFGLRAWEGHPRLMSSAHRHNELELNMVVHGTADYFFGGRRVSLSAGSLMLFWAIAPHQLVNASPDNFMYWLILPLSWFLHVQWPESFRRSVLNCDLLIDPLTSSNDSNLFIQWQADLTRNRSQDHEAVLLEAEARLKRLADQLDFAGNTQATPSATSQYQLTLAEKIARFLSAHYLEDLSVQTVAADVNLHPSYAMDVFRKSFGLTIIEYLTNLRVAHAQQLLVTTDQNVLTVALESGFGSLSQFYVAFKRLCGLSPREYRESLR